MSQKNNAGFSLMELMIVVVIIALVSGVTFYAMQKRASHFRLRGSTREVLQMMKMAQSAAIRSNSTYRLRVLTTKTYAFQFTSGTWQTPPATDGRLSQVQTLQSGITFSSFVTVPCGGLPCSTPQFKSDGTLNGGGSVRLTDNKENFTIQWTIGGSVRIP